MQGNLEYLGICISAAIFIYSYINIAAEIKIKIKIGSE